MERVTSAKRRSKYEADARSDLEDCPRCGGQFFGCLMGDDCEVEDFFYFEGQREQE